MSRWRRQILRAATFAGITMCLGIGCADNSTAGNGGNDDNGNGDEDMPVSVNAGLIELTPYENADVIPDPTGGSGEVVGGRILVDFADEVSLDTIDETLAGHGLRRVGIVGAINLVTAAIEDGASELEAQARIESEPTVTGAPLAYLSTVDAAAGQAPPIGYDTAADTPTTAFSFELEAMWPHYVMDTLPAHALVERVRGDALADVEIAIVDWGFHPTSGVDAVDAENSILADPDDGDLKPKILPPVSAVIAPAGDISVRTGDVSVASNPMLYAEDSLGPGIPPQVNLHGVAVASAAGAMGEQVLGTGKHVRIRPVRYGAQTTDALGDPVFQCSADTIAATLAYLAEQPFPDLRVLNMSWKIDIDDENQRARVARSLRAVLVRQEQAGRILVTTAGNRGDSGFSLPALLSPERDPSATPSAGGGIQPVESLLVIGGTRLPQDDAGDLRYEGRREGDFTLGANEGSNFGDNVFCSAPGQHVPVVMPVDDFTLESGTSLSAPYVAGVLGEMFALDSSLTAEEAIEILKTTCDDLAAEVGAPGWDAFFGWGRVNVWKAMLGVLNRAAPDEPIWLGVRFRTVVEGMEPAQVRIGGDVVPDTIVSKVPDLTEQDEDNAWSVPVIENRGIENTAWSTLFSFETGDIVTNLAMGLQVLEVRDPEGDLVYAMPLRLADLLSNEAADSAEPPGTSFDDGVVTFSIREPTSTVFGRVTRDGAPVADAEVTYTTKFGTPGLTFTDGNGDYIAYEALGDGTFDVQATAGGEHSAAAQVSTEQFTAVRRDLTLGSLGTADAAGCDVGGRPTSTRYETQSFDEYTACGGGGPAGVISASMEFDPETCTFTGRTTGYRRSTREITNFEEGRTEWCTVEVTVTREWTLTRGPAEEDFGLPHFVGVGEVVSSSSEYVERDFGFTASDAVCMQEPDCALDPVTDSTEISAFLDEDGTLHCFYNTESFLGGGGGSASWIPVD